MQELDPLLLCPDMNCEDVRLVLGKFYYNFLLFFVILRWGGGGLFYVDGPSMK